MMINLPWHGNWEDILEQQLEGKLPALGYSPILEKSRHKILCLLWYCGVDHRASNVTDITAQIQHLNALPNLPPPWALRLALFNELVEGCLLQEWQVMGPLGPQRRAFRGEVHQMTLGYLQIKRFFKATAPCKLSLVSEATWLSLDSPDCTLTAPDLSLPLQSCLQGCPMLTFLPGIPPQTTFLSPSPQSAQDRKGHFWWLAQWIP